MSDAPDKGPGAGVIVRVAVVACAACCAGPVLAFLGGVTVLGVAGTAFFGVAAATVAVAATTLFLAVHWRRAAHACASGSVPHGPVLVPAPGRRPGDDGTAS